MVTTDLDTSGTDVVGLVESMIFKRQHPPKKLKRVTLSTKLTISGGKEAPFNLKYIFKSTIRAFAPKNFALSSIVC